MTLEQCEAKARSFFREAVLEGGDLKANLRKCREREAFCLACMINGFRDAPVACRKSVHGARWPRVSWV